MGWLPIIWAVFHIPSLLRSQCWLLMAACLGAGEVLTACASGSAASRKMDDSASFTTQVACVVHSSRATATQLFLG